jgi:Holliday junction resolvase RusA-like endonuclease
MQPIVIVVPAIPVGQPRQRHRVLTVGGKTFAQNYTPQKSPVSDYKATLRMAAQQAYKGPPLEGPLSMTIIFYFASKRKQAIVKTTKPDLDNLVKSTLDAMNGLTFKDDSQVCKMHVEKWHSGSHEQPRVEIVISEVPSL